MKVWTLVWTQGSTVEASTANIIIIHNRPVFLIESYIVPWTSNQPQNNIGSYPGLYLSDPGEELTEWS